MRLALVLVPLALVLADGASTAPLAGQSLKVSERLEVLEERARADSNDPAAHYNLGVGHLSKEHFNQAEAALRQAVALDPQFAAAFLTLAIVRNKDGDFWRARRKAGPDSVRAAVRERAGYYTKAFLLDPLVDVRILGSVIWLRGWGDFAKGFKDLVEGKYATAFERFDKEVRREGSAPEQTAPALLWFRALAAAHSEKWDAAAADLSVLVNSTDRLVASDSAPDEAPLQANEYRYMLAAIRQRQERHDEAIQLYQQVIENDIGNYMAHVQLARIHESARDFPRAVQERIRATETNPDDPSLLLDLGITLGKAGMLPQAETRLHAATAANPRDTRALFWLGLAQAEQGKAVEARASLTRFVELAPSRYQPQVAMAKDRLARLQ